MKKKNYRSLLLRFDRILAQDLLRQVAILAFVLAIIFVISFFLLSISGSDWQRYCINNHISKWVFPLYLLIDSNAFNSFYSDQNVNGMAVFIACIIYIIGVVIFTGMIISVMTNMIERRVEHHRNGQIYYLKSGHYIIMGYDDMVPSFIRHIFDKDKEAFILILTSVNVLNVTEKLKKSFNNEQIKRIIINYGHRTTSESYKDIHLESAEEIFIVGYRGQIAHDAINVECVDCIYRYLNEQDQHPSKITCVFKDLDTYAAFKTTEIFDKLNELDIAFVPYNYYTGWAKQVFVKRYHRDLDDPNPDARIEYPAVFGKGIALDDPRYVHLVFVGTTNFAVAFAMEAAHVLHFPNFNHNKDLKTRITFIDLNADKEKDVFITRNRHFFEVQDYIYQDLSDKPEPPENWPNTKASYFEGKYAANFLDVEFEFIKGDIFSKKVQDEISRWANARDKQYLSIFLAMENQRSNFVMGMNMPDEVYDNRIPIFIRQDRSDNFVTNLRKADRKKILPYSIMKGKYQVKYEHSARYAHIYPFGMNETGFCADDKSIKRAKLINYLYCTADYGQNTFKDEIALNAIPEKDVWDFAEEKWKELPVALKWSNLYSSYTIRTKLASLRAIRGLDLDDDSRDFDPLSEKEIDELSQVEHNRWNVEKLLMGFRKPHKDEDKYEVSEEAKDTFSNNKKLFIHHDIRPYDELDDIQKLDKEFTRTIPWIMKMTEK